MNCEEQIDETLLSQFFDNSLIMNHTLRIGDGIQKVF
jgi:hypothetical protein